MSRFGICILFGLLAICSGYDVGVTNKYKYETTVLSDESCEVQSEKPVGFRLRATVHLTAVWQHPQKAEQKILQIKVLEPRLFVSKKTGFEKKQSILDKVSSTTSYFLWEDGTVGKFWDQPQDGNVLRNLKRGIANLIQLQSQEKNVKEKDVAGYCNVVYRIRGNTIERSKGNCVHPSRDKFLSQPFGVRSSHIQHSAVTECELKDGKTVSKCVSKDFLKMTSNLWKRPTLCTSAKSELLFEGQTDDQNVISKKDLDSAVRELKNAHTDGLIEGTLEAILFEEKQTVSKKLMNSVTKYQESLKTANLAKVKSASAFYKLLPVFRSATKEEILAVLRNKKFKPIMPQILDLLAASSTKDSLLSAAEYFGISKNYDELYERFLVSLSVLPRPDEFMLTSIKSLLEKGSHHEKIEATLLTTFGALLRTYSKSEYANPEVVEDTRLYMENKLKKCKDDICILSYMRGLRNAAQPRSSALLLEFALKGGKPALEALLALRDMRMPELTPESQQKLQKILHQVGQKQDRSVRTVAAELLLNGCTDTGVLKSVLSVLSDQSDAEFSTFLASKVLEMVEHDKELRFRVMKVLSEKEIAHYYSLSQKGDSSVFTKQLMSAEGINVTYGIGMEMLDGGLTKRSVFDVSLATPFGVSNLLTVGMFAEGLSSIAGGESSEAEDQNPTAGMELTFLESSLRPYIYFSSTSELMGHAWSGTASDLTPALQGIFALSDDENTGVLNNGMIVRLQLRGALSTDLSAAIQISLWNRNSQSQVKNAAALLVKGTATVSSDFVTTRGEVSFSGESAINFETDLEFYEAPFKMCLQMEHPSIVVRQDITRNVEIPDTKFLVRRSKKRKRFISGKSYALHQKNNEQCKKMKDSSY